MFDKCRPPVYTCHNSGFFMREKIKIIKLLKRGNHSYSFEFLMRSTLFIITPRTLRISIAFKPTKRLLSSSWINSSPKSIRPYLKLMRMDKQAGTLMLLWPCAWSIALAAPVGSLPSAILLAKFSIGAVLMRSAGCIINDIWDKDFDKHVERTKDRPLACGELSVPQALGALGLTLTASLAILMSMNHTSIMLGFASMPLVIAYPLMKRYTYFPQLVLGLAFNFGAFIGWTEVTGMLSLMHTLPLYIGGVCWTLVYDTIYGYQDRQDDAKLGKHYHLYNTS